MHKILETGSTIGIIGAGQLGKMLGLSAQKMGFKIAMYDPNPNSCGFNVAHNTTIADFSDRDALLQFVQSVDVVTYEFENINGDILTELEHKSYLPQGTELLLNSQDRVKEKNWINNLGISTTPFYEVNSFDDLLIAIKAIQYPAVLKTTRFGYDGKGQIVLRSQEDIETNFEMINSLLDKQPLILEDFCEFEFEVSVIVARDLLGQIEIFPISRNEHVHGVLYSSLIGAEYSEQLTFKIQEIARNIAEAGQLIGVCGIELFVTSDGNVLVNEIAPRPHNTGHYTIEATNVSQFDQHILAITGRPLINVRLMEPALMVNILGQHMAMVEAMSQEYPNALYHIYDKGEAKEQRKMGHFTLTDPNFNYIEGILQEAKSLKIWRDLF